MGDLRVGHHLWRIEHAEQEAGTEEAAQNDVHILLAKQTLPDSVQVLHVIRVVEDFLGVVDALVVHTHFERNGSRFFLGLGVVVARPDVHHGAAVRHDEAVESPRPAELVPKKKAVCAGRFAVDAVVGAHCGGGMALDDGGTESRQVGVFLIVLGDVHVESVTQRLGSAVDGEVLGRGDDTEILRVVALESGDEGNAHVRSEERIFAVGFLAASPAWVAEDVDVGRPEGKAFEDVAATRTDGLVVLGAGFGADHSGHVMEQRSIPGCAERDGLWEHSSDTRPGDAVKGLAPIVIRRNLKARNCTSLIYQL